MAALTLLVRLSPAPKVSSNSLTALQQATYHAYLGRPLRTDPRLVLPGHAGAGGDLLATLPLLPISERCRVRAEHGVVESAETAFRSDGGW